MQSRAARAITRAVVTAGTAGVIATAFYLLNRILDNSDHNCLENYLDLADANSEDGDGNCDNDKQLATDDGFALLPVVSESDDESEDDAVGYTGDYFTAPYDVCMLSVSVQTQVDPLPDVPAIDTSDCRLCRAATAAEVMDSASSKLDLGDKVRALSFSETDSSSNGSVRSIASELVEEYDAEFLLQRSRTCSRTEQWLYVRL